MYEFDQLSSSLSRKDAARQLKTPSKLCELLQNCSKIESQIYNGNDKRKKQHTSNFPFADSAVVKWIQDMRVKK